MKKLILTFLFPSLIFAQAIKRPKLVVGIVVDQMRYEYLHRFYDDFSNGGFKRLMKKGYVFHNMHYPYAPTYTAPGHASIYTGTTPSTHGIVGNHWFHKGLKQMVYSTTDLKENSLGVKGKEGQMSPRRMQTTTIGDELKLDTNGKAKVIGISIKDRSSILPAGHFADASYWFSDMGTFISSTYYMKKLPDWVVSFNNKHLAKHYMSQTWDRLKAKETYLQKSLPDGNPYQELTKDPQNKSFPYDLKAISDKTGIGFIKYTPWGNEILVDFALETLENEQLGQRNTTDLLAISFSSTDYIGHVTGPRSQEIQDTYIRLDLSLERLLNQLDKKVGRGQYLLFLTADHAAAENPAHLESLGYNVKSLSGKETDQMLRKFSKMHFGEDLVLSYYDFNLHLKEDLIKDKNLNYEDIIKIFQNKLMQQNWVRNAYTQADLRNPSQDFFTNMVSLGFDAKQNGDLVIQAQPSFIEYSKTGTTHGSVYSYDTHVPLLWYGWKVKKGNTHKRKDITMIAPTLAQMLGISFPNGSKGFVLEELLERWP